MSYENEDYKNDELFLGCLWGFILSILVWALLFYLVRWFLIT